MNVLEGDAVAQMAHFFAGWALTLTMALMINPFYAAGLVILGSAAKEAAESLGIAPWEPKQDWPSSITDFGFFCLGIAWALFVVYALSWWLFLRALWTWRF